MNEAISTTSSSASSQARVTELIEYAARVFGSSKRAHRWLSADSSVLGAKPMDLLADKEGLRSVEHELRRIDHGDFA